MDSERSSVLIGDIGGTNSRLSIVRITSKKNDPMEVVDQKTLVSFEYESVKDLIDTYLKPFKGSANFPVVAVLGVPAPINNNTLVTIVNIPKWKSVNGDDIAKEIGLKRIVFLNDFQVNGYGIQTEMAEGKDFFVLNKGTPVVGGTKGMIGAGTGLGMGYLVKSPFCKYYEVGSSEGGHQDFPSKTELHWKYFNYLKSHYQINHISIERACSGPVLYLMFRFLKQEEKLSGDAEIEKEVATIEGRAEELVLVNHKIISNGLEKKCKICRRVIEFFVELYGSAAGDLALSLLSTGGLYLLGGLSIALKDLLRDDPIFMQNLNHKGRLSTVLKNIPIYVVTDSNLGVRGSAEYARRLLEQLQSKK